MVRIFLLLALTGFCAAAAVAAPVISPDCPNPAPYVPAPGDVCVAPEHIVLFTDETDAVVATRELEQRCGFSDSEVFTSALEAFVAVVTPSQIACIRCDPRVRVVEENFFVPIPGFPAPFCAPPPIPTLGEIGTWALAAMLGIAGWFSVVRMR